MSRTLFWYIFLDLLRIFGLTSGVLSGIMSFGGLLRPLYEFGLSMPQVAKILAYSGPAMTAYSLPIAALFATTIVYGRFGADNEITACRAAGISHTAMAGPAFVLGLVTAFASIGLLCFAVPASMYKVEQVIFSNLADLVSNQIQRSHQISIDQGEDGPLTIHAESARVLAADPSSPGRQAVELSGPEIVTFDKADRGKPVVPKEFYFASSAIAYIDRPQGGDEPSITVDLTNIIKFPRDPISGNARTGSDFSMGFQRIGPKPMQSPIKENTKFMNIFRLKDVLNHPEQSQRVSDKLADFIRRDQQEGYLKMLGDQLNSSNGTAELAGPSETYVIQRGELNEPAQIVKGRLVVTGKPGTCPVQLIQTKGPQSLIKVDAGQMEIEANPDIDHRQLNVSIDMLDSVLTVGDAQFPRGSPQRAITVAMPPEILALKDRTFDQYMNSNLSADEKWRLIRESKKLINSVISEMHARMSFALSCLILVMVGCALGMMFRSGNFLSAFAVSVVPALLSIALVVTGQHTCENVPPTLSLHWQNPLNLGLMIIWSGNAVVLVIGVVLLVRLHRQ